MICLKEEKREALNDPFFNVITNHFQVCPLKGGHSRRRRRRRRRLFFCRYRWNRLSHTLTY